MINRCEPLDRPFAKHDSAGMQHPVPDFVTASESRNLVPESIGHGYAVVFPVEEAGCLEVSTRKTSKRLHVLEIDSEHLSGILWFEQLYGVGTSPSREGYSVLPDLAKNLAGCFLYPLHIHAFHHNS